MAVEGRTMAYLLAGPAGDGTLQLHEGAADLVADGGVAPRVLHVATAAEEVAAAGAGRGRGLELHFDC